METPRRGISIGQAATVLANVGVLVGLIFVIVELQQNRLSLQAEIELSLAQSYQTAMGRSLENPDFAELLTRGFANIDSLSTPELVRMMSWNAEWMAIVYATYNLWQAGAVSEEIWTQHAGYFALFFQSEQMRDFWRSNGRGVYPQPFLDEFERLLPQPQP